MDERTTEIIVRFKSSWTDTKVFYDTLITEISGWEKLNSVRSFIEKMEQMGENNYFRLGTSVDRLKISRSVDPRLRIDQKYIMIEAVDVRNFRVTLQDGKQIYRDYKVEDLGDEKVINLLKTLKHTLVD